MTSRGMRFGKALMTAGLLAATQTPVLAQPASEQIEVSARPITTFKIGRSEARFGPLEFVGGLELTSSSGDFGGLSSFRFLEPGGDLIAVSDTGFWLFGSITRDAQHKPIGLDHVRMEPMIDGSGKTSDRKRDVDAEGLAVKDGVATVGFERDHRIVQFEIEPGAMKGPLRRLDFLVPARELRQNRGFETVVHAQPEGRHKDGLVVVSEKSLDQAGNIFAAIIEGPGRGVFTVRRDGEFDITDGAFLPGGDLLLLERSFSFSAGIAMRLRRIHGESIAKGKVADGPVLFSADMGYQIDNMEGLDVWRRDDGALLVSLLSDDNQSILQRNLYLEFILHED
jgi:hypothetical protein